MKEKECSKMNEIRLEKKTEMLIIELWNFQMGRVKKKVFESVNK